MHAFWDRLLFVLLIAYRVAEHDGLRGFEFQRRLQSVLVHAAFRVGRQAVPEQKREMFWETIPASIAAQGSAVSVTRMRQTGASAGRASPSLTGTRACALWSYR